MGKLFANNGDPDQTPRSAASDLGLHCLLVTLKGVSRLQWVNILSTRTSKPHGAATKGHCNPQNPMELLQK